LKEIETIIESKMQNVRQEIIRATEEIERLNPLEMLLDSQVRFVRSKQKCPKCGILRKHNYSAGNISGRTDFFSCPFCGSFDTIRRGY
jgi:hypothetical protein